MSPITSTVIFFVLGAVFIHLYTRWRAAAQAEYVRSYVLPVGLYDKLRQKRINLTLKECQLVGQGLRQFFLAYLRSGCQPVAMPSQVVDDLWHEFILYTKHYDVFCKRAFGKFMHHTPTAVLSPNKRSNAKLRRVWWYACKEENINPRKATRLPLLFALDAKLNIADGFLYAVDCHAQRQDSNNAGATVTYCGGDFSSSGIDGTTDGFGDTSAGDSSDSGCSGGCSGGCGGGGCGGD
jgi:hypothetical protein